MGRIKSKIVKRTSKILLNEENNVFTEKFENNKEFLKGLMPSKKIRNQVAGYITRLKRMRTKEKINN
jgi:small subunit ribosomal protein S17e